MSSAGRDSLASFRSHSSKKAPVKPGIMEEAMGITRRVHPPNDNMSKTINNNEKQILFFIFSTR